MLKLFHKLQRKGLWRKGLDDRSAATKSLKLQNVEHRMISGLLWKFERVSNDDSPLFNHKRSVITRA